MMRVWRLSVAYIGPKSRTERPRKTKIGIEVAHVTRDSDTTFKVKGQLAGGGGILWRPPAQLVCEDWRYAAIAVKTACHLNASSSSLVLDKRRRSHQQDKITHAAVATRLAAADRAAIKCSLYVSRVARESNFLDATRPDPTRSLSIKGKNHKHTIVAVITRPRNCIWKMLKKWPKHV